MATVARTPGDTYGDLGRPAHREEFLYILNSGGAKPVNKEKGNQKQKDRRQLVEKGQCEGHMHPDHAHAQTDLNANEQAKCKGAVPDSM